MASFVTQNFIPLRFHVKKDQAAFQRFGAEWTPTIVILDANGEERHRIEGFLPAGDLLAQLHLALGHLEFRAHRFDEAERHFRDVLSQFPESDSAAEAQYWAGVSKYKKSNDAAALSETAAAFKQRYGDTAWAKKASVWG